MREYVERKGGCQPRWRLVVDSLVSLLAPCRCLVCGLDSDPDAICPGCLADLPWMGEACQHCGTPGQLGLGQPCGACLQNPPPWDAVRAAFTYDFPIRQLIRRYKFQRQLAAGAALAELLAMEICSRDDPLPDLLLPVPLHPLRLLKRGFNQSYDIARILHRRLGIPLINSGLRRVRSTMSQAGLEARERRRNLQRAFAWRGQALAGCHVALIDDVMTTGSTLAECAGVLRRSGAGRIDAWVLARAREKN